MFVILDLKWTWILNKQNQTSKHAVIVGKSLKTVECSSWLFCYYAAEQLCVVTRVCLLLFPVYLFMGLMMMYLLLRTLHKMADLHGLTTFLQLPRCEESDQDEDREPIVETEHEAAPPSPVEPLDPGSQSSYNTITKDWVK